MQSRISLIVALLLLCGQSFAGVEWVATNANVGTFPTKPTADDHADGPVIYTITCASDGTTPNLESDSENAFLDTSLTQGDSIRYSVFAADGTTRCVWDGGATGVNVNREWATPVTVTTTEYAKLPPLGTRITGAYKPIMPRLRRTSNTPFFGIGNKASGVIFRGLWHEKHSSITDTNGFYTMGQMSGTPVTPETNAFSGINAISGRVTSSSTCEAGDAACVFDDVSEVTAGDSVAICSETCSTASRDVCTVDTVDVATKTLTFTECCNSTGSICNSAPGTLVFSHPTNHYLQYPNSTIESLPSNITWTQDIFSQEVPIYKIRRFVSMQGSDLTIRDSYCAGAMEYGTDSQCFWGIHVNGLGLYNNYIGGASEGFMNGGVGANPGTFFPTGFTLQYNYFAKIAEADKHTVWPGANQIVWAGLHVKDTVNGDWYMALNTGATGASEPTWTNAPSTGNEIVDNQVAWRNVGTSSVHPLIKNHFEIKFGKNLTAKHNVFDGYWKQLSDAAYGNGTQYSSINIKANNQPGCDYDGTDQFPTCYATESTNILIDSNYFKNQDSSLLEVAAGASAGFPKAYGGILFRNNLAVMSGSLYYLSKITPHDPLGVAGYGFPYSWNRSPASAPDGFEFSHNTVYAAAKIDGTDRDQAFFAEMATSTSVTEGSVSSRIFGNIFPTGASGTFQMTSNSGDKGFVAAANRVNGSMLADLLNCTYPCASNWKKNILLGSADENYPAGSAWTGCGNSSACAMDWTTVLRNTTSDFRLKTTHTFWNAVDGKPAGADPMQVPRIMNLRVSPTDTEVLFQWSVTPVIADTPCVIEVHTAPDFVSSSVGGVSTGYRAECSDPNILGGAAYKDANGNNLDSSEHNRHTRRGLQRMISLGHTVPLTPGAHYYYRLSCAGDSIRGEFDTHAALEGTTTLTVRQAGASSIIAGTAYSRALDEDGDPGTEPITDGIGGSCLSTICQAAGLERGKVYFYRVASGPVRAVAIQ